MEVSEDRIDDDENKLDYDYMLNDRKSDNAKNFHLTNPLKLVQNLPFLKACIECSRWILWWKVLRVKNFEGTHGAFSCKLEQHL